MYLVLGRAQWGSGGFVGSVKRKDANVNVLTFLVRYAASIPLAASTGQKEHPPRELSGS